MTVQNAYAFPDIIDIPYGKVYGLQSIDFVSKFNGKLLQRDIMQIVVDERGNLYVIINKRTTKIARQILGQNTYAEIVIATEIK
jgi:hypothetical protein